MKFPFPEIFKLACRVALFACSSGPSYAGGASLTALAGLVTSTEEGPMEGVVVGAKKDGSTVTVSVVSDNKGRWSFPADRLSPGHYTLSIRAAGYDVDGTNAIDVLSGETSSTDVRLRKTRDLADQLTNAEWLESIPGADGQKNFFLNCNSCHTIERILKSHYNADEFVALFNLMAGFYPGATPLHPQRLPGRQRNLSHGASLDAAAKYLASINLSTQKSWSFPLRTFPRLTGRSTHVIITEYDLPRKTMEPHDVLVDKDGFAWFSNFGEQSLGRMDVKTGQVVEFPIPLLKKDYPTGSLDLETGPDGDLWIAMMFQGGIARFDKKAEKFTIYPLPAEWQSPSTQQTFVSPGSSDKDGKVWVKNSDGDHMLRLDLATGKYEDLGQYHDASGREVWGYGIPTDSQNNLYMLDFSAADVGRINAKTKQLTVYPTPTARSRPRRGRADSDDRIWFAEYGANSVGVLDTKGGQISEWRLPTPWNNPYDVVLDKNGDAWTAGMQTDRITRINSKTSEITEYQLPRSTNVRRIFVDNSTDPVTVWVGSNHGASIVKVEPLD
jgi:virginiamycin B lyase